MLFIEPDSAYGVDTFLCLGFRGQYLKLWEISVRGTNGGYSETHIG